MITDEHIYIKLYELVLTIPVTSAADERSCSALKRLKTI
jgi:hypothetical protein